MRRGHSVAAGIAITGALGLGLIFGALGRHAAPPVTPDAEVYVNVGGAGGTASGDVTAWSRDGFRNPSPYLTAANFNEIGRRAGCPYDVAVSGDLFEHAVRALLDCVRATPPRRATLEDVRRDWHIEGRLRCHVEGP